MGRDRVAVALRTLCILGRLFDDVSADANTVQINRYGRITSVSRRARYRHISSYLRAELTLSSLSLRRVAIISKDQPILSRALGLGSGSHSAGVEWMRSAR